MCFIKYLGTTTVTVKTFLYASCNLFNDLSHKYVQMTLRDRNTKHLCNMFTFVDICQMIIAQEVVQKKKEKTPTFVILVFLNIVVSSTTA